MFFRISLLAALLAVLAWFLGRGDERSASPASPAGTDVDATRAPAEPLNASNPDNEAGYIMYCPCMGRFGNQADYLLGMLGVAKRADRTLVVPPFIFYEAGRRFADVETVFDLQKLRNAGRVVTLREFRSRKLPLESFLSLCPFLRGGTCSFGTGQPAEDFWSHALGPGVVPPASSAYPQALVSGGRAKDWARAFPAELHPVLVFTGVPVPFPVLSEDIRFQRYLSFAPAIADKAKQATSGFPRPWIAAHVRYGSDWDGACRVGVGRPEWMSSPQCLAPGEGNVTMEMCYPPLEDVARDIAHVAAPIGAKAAFVASDDKNAVDALRTLLKARAIELLSLPDADPLVELAVMSSSDAAHFVGNCAPRAASSGA
ncbi:GDP-fucose protein O-fucosyltransferase [Hyaloraphidium curvatum]|nr:GDP-fucose protein O-fucosyltransferase [Hyaloraphidium curvatum]